MKCRQSCLFVLLLIGLLPLWACRIILPPQPPIQPPMPHPVPRLSEMEVKEHRAEIEIDGRVATVHVSATFHNPNNARIEGTYYFPIHPRAAVSSFAMTVNGKTMEAELLPSDRARSIYENIVRQQRDPAILEYIDQGMLKARVFPIEPRQDVKIELTYSQQVETDGALSRVRYPLLSARPGGENLVQSCIVKVNLKTASGITTLFTPGFDTEIERPELNQAELVFEARDFRPDKDFEIVFSQNEQPVGVDFLTYRKGDEGYFAMFISPQSELQEQEIAQKDIVFVIDTSGSMNGKKIEQAKEGLRYCINSLGENDHFNVIAFSTDIRPLADASLAATPSNRQRALDFVDGLKARGGTAIDDAAAFALKAERAGGAVPMVVFMTDGLPTIGETDVGAILKRFKGDTPRRFFTMGVGYDVNTRLLNGVAAETGGYPAYVRPEEDLEVAISSFYEKVASPVMTDLRLQSTGVKLSAMNPRQLPDLFKGQQLVVTGRFAGEGKAAINVEGAVGSERQVFSTETTLAGDPRNAWVSRLWASQRVAWLQEQIQLHGSNEELVNEIKRLGREYGIVTPYTSFLIVEEGMAEEELANARRELAAGEVAAPAASQTGRAAVERARDAAKLRGNAGGGMDFGAVTPGADKADWSYDERQVAEALERSGKTLADVVRRVEDRAFYRRAGGELLWDATIPADQSPEPDLDVAAYSQEFFAAVRAHPELKRYMLLGESFIVKLDGKLIRVRMDKGIQG